MLSDLIDVLLDILEIVSDRKKNEDSYTGDYSNSTTSNDFSYYNDNKYYNSARWKTVCQ